MNDGSIALVAVGANQGCVEKNIRLALRALEATPDVEICRISSFVYTLPVGGPRNQPPYLNGAVLLETSIPAPELLKILQDIEKRLHRVRTVIWGPRTIDLDLILYGDSIITQRELTLPHPRVYWRLFVLDPACEIASDLILPTSGLTLAQTRRLLYINFEQFETTVFLQRCLSYSVQ